MFLGSAAFQRRAERITSEVKADFERQLLAHRAQVEWKREALSELLGPVVMQLDRTRRAFNRWQGHNQYLEFEIIHDGNQTVRDLLLTKGHLIPEELRDVSGRLIEHYDAWLEKFEQVRKGPKADLEAPFVFVGPDGYPFPPDANELFQASFTRLWQEVYGAPGAPRLTGATRSGT